MSSKRSELFDRLNSERPNAEWGPSPVEIWKHDIHNLLNKNLLDFRRSKISSGTINPPDRPKSTHQEPYPDDGMLRRCLNTFLLIVFLIRLEIHSLRQNNFLFKYRSELNSINFRKFSLPKNLMSDIGIRMSYYSCKIKKLNLEKPIILEIGAGYGALCNYLNGSYSRYIVVDLIENLILASQYLEEAGIKYGTSSDLSNVDVPVILISGGELQDLTKVDLVINTMSMQHMTEQNLTYYFGQIDRLNPELIYLVNRNIKRDLSDIEIQNYPIPKNYTVETKNFIYSKHYTEALFRRSRS